MVEMAAVIGTGVQNVLALAEADIAPGKRRQHHERIMSRDTGHPLSALGPSWYYPAATVLPF
jgi:hypothetical protein